jgi:single-strand DNA-binding protein
MNGLNKVIIVGTLGTDPKEYKTKDGASFTALSLATRRSWKNKEGEAKTDWHRVMVWGKQALVCQQFLKKGSPICVEGHLSNYESEDADGKRQWRTSISADHIEFMSQKREEAH